MHGQSGDPLTLSSNAELNGGSASAHGNYIGGAKYSAFSRTNPFVTYLNATAFCGAENPVLNGLCDTSTELPVGNTPFYGNTGTGVLRGPGRINFDMTATKTIPISEKFGGVELRASAFNIFNHTQLGDPDTSTNSLGSASPTFGVITGANGPRTLQGAIRYKF